MDDDWVSNDNYKVCRQSLGHALYDDLTQHLKNPRGIRGYTLLGGGDFTTWKLAGNLGGEDYPDKVRGGLNEGGFWAERSGPSTVRLARHPARLTVSSGAILPGFNDGSWKASSPLDGITKPGVQVYRTKFNLDVPAGIDAPLALKFTQTLGSNYRSVIYVNGWNVSRYPLCPFKFWPTQASLPC